MKESVFIKFLYKTTIGRFILKLLVNPTISRASAKFLSSSYSRWLVPIFVKRNGIDLIYYNVPDGGYQSFNDFFTRQMKERYIGDRNGELVCPCDGLLTISEIDEESIFHIKHTEYSLAELLKNDELAEEYKGGTAFIFRLTPAHYHRYIWATTGSLKEKEKISGILHSVQPICHEKTKVFVQNSREYSVINNSSLGKVVQMEIGALLVGKISNYDVNLKQIICSGQEKGFFEYGGSSIVLLTKERHAISEDILYRYTIGNEIPVIIGEQLIRQ